MKYYPIDEDAARRAKNANSLSDYAEGSATSEYRREVNRAATLAEECKKGKTDAQQEKIDYLLDRYARRLADNMNASNRNRASCPSVMVAGWSNFPVRKKQQQLSRDDTLMRECPITALNTIARPPYGPRMSRQQRMRTPMTRPALAQMKNFISIM